jgi:carbonic anhydrase
VTNDEIRKLIDGFGRFRTKHFGTRDGLFERLTRHGQSPRIMVIACCDSRVDPAIITDCDPGDLFVVRNVANLVPPCETGGNYHGTSAALEFAVRFLQVRHVIVLGHARCGGIEALLRGRDRDSNFGQFIHPWMEIAAEARATVLSSGSDPTVESTARAAEQAAIRVSLRNLETFPWVRERIENGQLNLHGWYFDIQQGQLLRFDPTQSRFVALS